MYKEYHSHQYTLWHTRRTALLYGLHCEVPLYVKRTTVSSLLISHSWDNIAIVQTVTYMYKQQHSCRYTLRHTRRRALLHIVTDLCNETTLLQLHIEAYMYKE